MKRTSSLASVGLLLALAPAALADLTAYSQDFEALNAADAGALTAAGFTVFANVFTPGGGYLYGYGAPAPNGGPGFSQIVTGAGGAAQGAQQLNVYNDYNNGDHVNGNFIDALVYREQPVGAANVGQTWTMSFDYLRNPVVTNGQGSATMFAFVKVLQSSNGSYATLAEQLFETTAVSTSTWGSTTIDFVIAPNFAGELLQFGFRSYATNYDDTSVLYDNLSFSQTSGPIPSLTPYSQDFEALNLASPDALWQDGYRIFANVRDPLGNLLYNYGVFNAPNGGAGFSAIGTGDGGPFQGAQYLNVYSDYNNGDHGNGNYIEALVFREQPVGVGAVGQTWRLSFDVRRNPLVTNGQGDSTMFAFIKVLQSSNGTYADLAVVEREVTGATEAEWASFALDLLVDPTYAGELLQFGFRSVATNYFDTGRYYDNISFAEVTSPGLGQVICLGNPMSTGSGALLTLTGSDVAADNNLTLSVSGLPTNSLGYFLTSDASSIIYLAGGSQGHLCIASPAIGRYAGNILNSGGAGQVSLPINLTSIPTPTGNVAALAGQTRNFQYWSRDMVGGAATSNFSSAASITFQ
ncbi:MAG: hypothetical protein R3F49_11745 [Planctomycetota bacterium]